MLSLLVLYKIVPIITIIIIGVSKVAEGLFEHFYGKDIEIWYDNQHKIIQTISKPLFYCPLCMSSVWTFTIFWSLQKFDILLVPIWICTTFAVAFTTNLTTSIINKYVP